MQFHQFKNFTYIATEHDFQELMNNTNAIKS